MKRISFSEGFTLIELMIAIGLTLFVVGTYLRFFSHTARYEGNNMLKTNISLKGEYITEALEGSFRLIGLANTSTDMKNGSIISSADGAATTVANGGYQTDTVTFTFISPWGGPVTRTDGTPLGTAPNCTLFPANLNSILGGNQSFLLITKNGIYKGLATIDPSDPGQIPISSLDPNATGSCSDLFPPEGTVITGLNRQYSLRYVNGSLSFSYTVPPDTTAFPVFSYPQEEVPFFALQFLTETKDSHGVVTSRQWETNPTDLSIIKAVRFGFVLTARGLREGGATPNTFSYCFFDNICYSAAANTNRRYVAFSRVVHLRNYDSLKEHLAE